MSTIENQNRFADGNFYLTLKIFLNGMFNMNFKAHIL